MPMLVTSMRSWIKCLEMVNSMSVPMRCYVRLELIPRTMNTSQSNFYGQSILQVCPLVNSISRSDAQLFSFTTSSHLKVSAMVLAWMLQECVVEFLKFILSEENMTERLLWFHKFPWLQHHLLQTWPSNSSNISFLSDLILCFSSTKHRVSLYDMSISVFVHSQLHIALSWATSSYNIKVLLPDDATEPIASNIVYKEVCNHGMITIVPILYHI